MSTIANLAVIISADLSRLDKDLTKAQSMLKQTGASMSKTGKMLTKSVTLPLIAIGAIAVKTVARFDDSMSKVQAISGATGEEIAKLRDMAKDLGAQTRYSASEAADAMSYLALAGWDTNQILAATPDMLSLAAAAGMDLATAADIVSDTMSAFQMSAERGGEAADVFAKISSSANTNVLQLGEAMKYAAASANAAGMDVQQTASILGVLADSGIKGSMAGTTFANMLREVKGAAEDGAMQIGKMNIEVYRQDGSMRDLGAIMGDVEKATKGMTAAQRDSALGMHFGERSMRGVNIMLATGADRYNELANAAYNSAGAAAKMADTMEDNIGGTLRALKSQFEGILIQLGEQLVPVLREDIIPLVKQFGAWISDLTKKFSEMDPQKRQMVIRLIAIAAAAGPVLFVVGKLTSGLGSLIGGVGRFITWSGRMITAVKAAGGALAFLAANPIVLVIAAIAAVIAIGVLLWKNWDKVREFGQATWGKLSAFMDTTLGKIVMVMLGPIGIGLLLIKNWDKIAEVAKRAFTAAADAVKSAVNVIIRGINWLIRQANRIPGINIPILAELELSTEKAQREAREARAAAQSVMDDWNAGRAAGTAADMALFGETDVTQRAAQTVAVADRDLALFGETEFIAAPLQQVKTAVSQTTKAVSQVEDAVLQTTKAVKSTTAAIADNTDAVQAAATQTAKTIQTPTATAVAVSVNNPPQLPADYAPLVAAVQAAVGTSQWAAAMQPITREIERLVNLGQTDVAAALLHAAAPELPYETARRNIEQRGLESFDRGGTVSGPIGQPRYIVAHGGETVRTPQQEASLRGGGVTINVTGNHIASDYDVDRIGELLVRRFRLAGIVP